MGAIFVFSVYVFKRSQILGASSWLTQAIQSINKYLRQSPPFHPYTRKTLNSVWDPFIYIWSERLRRLHPIFTSFSGSTTIQFACFLLYFIMCHEIQSLISFMWSNGGSLICTAVKKLQISVVNMSACSDRLFARCRNLQWMIHWC